MGKELAYQRNLLQTVTDNASSCLLMIDSSGRGTFANAATERITGFKAAEMIGAVLHDKIHHTHRDGTPFAREDCPIDCSLSGSETLENYEELFVHKDGHFYPARCAARPILKDGAPVGTVIEVHDITAEKQAQESIRSSEERLRLALEAAGAGMWDLDLETGAMVWSPENCRIYGLDPERYLPQYETWRALVHPDDLARVEQERAASIRAHRSYRVEYRIRRPSGEVRWVSSQGRAYDDQHGNPVRMLGINIDITKRKRTEEERFKFQALVESSNDYIGMAEPGGNYFYLNPAGCALVGVDSDALSLYFPAISSPTPTGSFTTSASSRRCKNRGSGKARYALNTRRAARQSTLTVRCSWSKIRIAARLCALARSRVTSGSKNASNVCSREESNNCVKPIGPKIAFLRCSRTNFAIPWRR